MNIIITKFTMHACFFFGGEIPSLIAGRQEGEKFFIFFKQKKLLKNQNRSGQKKYFDFFIQQSKQ